MRTMFPLFWLTPKTVIVERQVLHRRPGNEIDATAHRGQRSQQIPVLDLLEECHISNHPSRWNRAPLHTVTIAESSLARRTAILSLSDIQMSKPRHASVKRISSTPDTTDVPQLTRATENGIGTTTLTLLEILYVRPPWGLGEGQSINHLSCYVASSRRSFPTHHSLLRK